MAKRYQDYIYLLRWLRREVYLKTSWPLIERRLNLSHRFDGDMASIASTFGGQSQLTCRANLTFVNTASLATRFEGAKYGN